MKRLLLAVLFLVGLLWALASFPGLANKGEYDSIILDFRDDLSAEQVEQQLQTLSSQFGLTPTLNSPFSKEDRVYVLEGDRSLLKTLKRSDLKQYAEAVEPNYIYHAFDVPNDPDYVRQWNFRSINLEKAWADSKGKGVTVAVIDTGISRVRDLEKTEFVPGYDFVNDREDASDDNGHGTHVAGTIAQSTNNGYGVAGIAYEAKLMPLKVLSRSGGGTVSDIAEAIRFAADHGADVINMSLGGGGANSQMEEAIAYAHGKGVVIVAAAGNSGTNAAAYPARYSKVIAVSALDASGNKTPYSNYGAGVNISAPGGSTSAGEAGGILQETINPETGEGIFRAFQGTSMAAPHVAGVAALVKASGIDDPSDVAQVLYQSARKVSSDELNHFGAGHLDAAAAVQVAQRGKISFRDFFRWLRENGYLNPRFWFDGGVVSLLPKVLMVLGAYLLAWFLRNFLPFLWNWFFAGGLVIGSAGLFLLRGLYVFDAPQWPLRLMGSSIPELGTAVQGSTLLNPITASVLIPLGLVVLLLSNPNWKWFAIGSSLGVASCLAISALLAPSLLWIGSGAIAQIFLGVNALLCFLLAYLALKSEAEAA
ncbi:MAG: S8 family peptidase [Synechococcales bacterium]|nr:S8 family peptidase [Synechococcales bacterium]